MRTAPSFVRKDEQDMFEGLATRDKDPRKSLHVQGGGQPRSSARARRPSP